MSSETGTSPYCYPCENSNHWIEILVRDEFNQPFSGVSGVLIDGAGNEFSISLGEAPILLEELAPGVATLKLDSQSWLIEAQGDKRTPNSEANPTKEFASEYQGHQDSTPKYVEITAGDVTELAEGEVLPSRHQKGKADSLKLVVDNSYVLQVRGFNFITLRVGMFFDGTGNNTYSAQWGKKQLEKYQSKWRQIYDADCQLISERSDYEKNNIPITELSEECFKYPEEENFLVKLFSESDDEVETVEGSATNELTNIQKLFDLYKKNVFSEDGDVYHHAVYVTGIGTGNNIAVAPADESLFGQGTGIGDYGVEAKVITAINSLTSTLKKEVFPNFPEDLDGLGKIDIDVFGFSRGAAAARHFINMLLDGKGSEFSTSFEKAVEEAGFILSKSFDWAERDVDKASCIVRFAGLFDTVASIVHLVSLDAENLLDLDFSTHKDSGDVRLWLDPSRVMKAVHLTADPTLECRDNFSLNHLNEHANFSELVLPGAHSDIGGGYQSVHTYKNSNFLLPELEMKRIKRISRAYSSDWEKKRAENYITENLQDFVEIDQRTGWKKEDYYIPDFVYRKVNSSKNIVTGSAYIKRRVRGELSRLYLRLMYGLASFNEVPFEDESKYVWTDNPYYTVLDIEGNSGFKELNEQILELAMQGKCDDIERLLSNEERRNEFMYLNLVHHSCDDSFAFKPLYDKENNAYRRASYNVTQED
ncbi:phospholipase effector Tle1 domain-containing protein [Vibrio sp. NH-UV-68]|uniref:T6SS phospholipase effector Tle1-like catalytic domain-containing protein n=1 Tax=unclassified Vibrio TaxID=2614977 RepID=UPI0036F2E96A